MLSVEETELPISEVHSDIFDPFSDDTVGLSGEYADADQSDPEQGSPVELGGQETAEDVNTVARPIVPGIVTQNLSGQSTSPQVFEGSSEDDYSGAGPAAGSVDLGGHDGDTTVLSAMNKLGPNLAEGVLTQAPQSVTGPTTADAKAVVLVPTSQSGLSLHANLFLFFLLGVAGYFVVKGLYDGA